MPGSRASSRRKSSTGAAAITSFFKKDDPKDAGDVKVETKEIDKSEGNMKKYLK